ncbi:hypothetical protein [Xanthobacter versatilis]|uniref:hypothetical protein n=1 Tax=Xanthobacter autotrophicus (strain ATCC BAA-1158 / Py2) TaxID=78245 RepID=UPI00372A0BC9
MSNAIHLLPNCMSTRFVDAVNDSSRWHLTRVPPEEVGGYCTPRKSAEDDATITYHYGNLIDDPIYMAHELGHLVSDDLLNAAGYNYQMAPAHIIEIPAFFAQHLIYDYLINHGPMQLRAAAAAHLRKEMRSQFVDIAIGAAAQDSEKVVHMGTQAIEDSFAASMQDWFGNGWRNHFKADQVAQCISDPVARDETIRGFLHKHATASFLAMTLYKIHKNLSRETSETLVATIFGRVGPYVADDLFALIGVRGRQQIAKFMKETVRTASGAFQQSTPPKPNSYGQIHALEP